MAVGRPVDPYPVCNFLVEIDGLEVGGFSEVSGLRSEVEVHEYREGGLNEHLHKFWGPVKHPSNLILKRGLMDSETLWSWQEEIEEGKVTRRNLSVVLCNLAKEEKCRWNFSQAYPVRWQGPDLGAMKPEVAVEVLELVHNGFKMVRT